MREDWSRDFLALYGPGRSVLMRKFLAGEAVLEGDGTRWINQIHRDDAARAIVQLVERRRETRNLQRDRQHPGHSTSRSIRGSPITFIDRYHLMDLRTCSENEAGRASVSAMEGCGKQIGSRYFPHTETPSLLSLKIKTFPRCIATASLFRKDAIDANGHANNVEYLRWMQDAAIGHADASGGADATRRIGASWVVRRHHIEYLQSAFAGDLLLVLTWVSNLRKASSLRKYLVLREIDLRRDRSR